MNNAKSYISFLFSLLIYVLFGAIAALFAGYLLGAVVGFAVTFYNNNFLPESPQTGFFGGRTFSSIFSSASPLCRAQVPVFFSID